MFCFNCSWCLVCVGLGVGLVCGRLGWVWFFVWCWDYWCCVNSCSCRLGVGWVWFGRDCCLGCNDGVWFCSCFVLFVGWIGVFLVYWLFCVSCVFVYLGVFVLGGWGIYLGCLYFIIFLCSFCLGWVSFGLWFVWRSVGYVFGCFVVGCCWCGFWFCGVGWWFVFVILYLCYFFDCG